MEDFTHFNEQGRAKMVNVGEKPISERTAVAAGSVLVNENTFALIRSGGMKKGDVLTTAQIAGIMGAKRTSEVAEVSCDGRTGVEMEALTAVSIAALTVYDMCKAVQKDMVITDIRLLRKTGGVHGDFIREDGK